MPMGLEEVSKEEAIAMIREHYSSWKYNRGQSMTPNGKGGMKPPYRGSESYV